jgi:hypothetical protein
MSYDPPEDVCDAYLEAYQLGYLAGEQGKPKESNPHASRPVVWDDELYRWWASGWEDGQVMTDVVPAELYDVQEGE